MHRLGKVYLGVLILLFTALMVVVPVEGQIRENSRIGEDGQISVCHATGSRENPYVTMEVKDNGVAHRRHPADIVPAPSDGCPGPGGVEPTEPVPEPLTMLLFGAGVAGVGYTARKWKRRK